MAKTYPSISVCMIVKNEEKNLPRLLSSIEGLADEIIVVDTGSDDASVAVAERFGAKIGHFEWCDDFSAARNESLAHATKDYILWLDGDDEIEKSEHRKIKEHLKNHNGSAVFLKLKNVHTTEETEATQLRMFPNHRDIRFTGRIHEQVYFSIAEKKIGSTRCDAIVLHHGYQAEHEIAEKLERNLRIHEKEIGEDPHNPYPYFFAARTYRGSSKPLKALEDYLKFIEKAKDRPDVAVTEAYKIGLLETAEAYCLLEKPEDAITLLEASISLFPQFGLFGFMLGRLYYELKEYEKAYQVLLPLRGYRFENEVVPVEVRKSRHLLNQCLGVSAIFSGDFAVAKEALEGAIELEPQNPDNYHYLSLAMEKSGDIEGALLACDRGIEVSGIDGILRKRRFLLHSKNGDSDKALQDFEELNGSSGDIDVLSAMFLINCRKLDGVGISTYYKRLQQDLDIEPQAFPDGIDLVRNNLAVFSEHKASELFESAISHLLHVSS